MLDPGDYGSEDKFEKLAPRLGLPSHLAPGLSEARPPVRFHVTGRPSRFPVGKCHQAQAWAGTCWFLAVGRV